MRPQYHLPPDADRDVLRQQSLPSTREARRSTSSGFKPLNYVDRIRLAAMVLRARAVTDWRQLESLTAREWAVRLGGDTVYKVVWEPLLRGKFGAHEPDISAVWFWNKLKLRGGSRNGRGNEVLAYYRGGIAMLLARRIADEIVAKGGRVLTGAPADSLLVDRNRVTGVITAHGSVNADAVIATPSLPIIADLIRPHVSATYVDQLSAIHYLSNICVVLELDRSLSDIITGSTSTIPPFFPFVGVIEHTNFEPAETYGGRHIVYLSKYLAETDPLYALHRCADALTIPSLTVQRMFPDFSRGWILASHVWHARFAQPIVTRNYPSLDSRCGNPLDGFYIASMAQIYPEDRGTNYAVREGRAIAQRVSNSLSPKQGEARRSSSSGG